MKSCNISHKVIKTITSNLTSCIHIDSVESFHNICNPDDVREVPFP